MASNAEMLPFDDVVMGIDVIARCVNAPGLWGFTVASYLTEARRNVVDVHEFYRNSLTHGPLGYMTVISNVSFSNSFADWYPEYFR